MLLSLTFLDYIIIFLWGYDCFAQKELLQAASTAHKRGREEQPHIQGVAAARVQEGQRKYSTFKVRRGRSEQIPLVQSKEQQLHFAGAAMKRYPPNICQVFLKWLMQYIKEKWGKANNFVSLRPIPITWAMEEILRKIKTKMENHQFT